MTINSDFIFTSKRLGFRNWTDADLATMIKISANPKVMHYFPAVATEQQTIDFIEKMRILFVDKGYCYFAAVELCTEKTIGFIGLQDTTYDAPFTPAVDIGWRLSPEFWNKGYATEGANRVLKFGFEKIGLHSIISTAPLINQPSIHVMERSGMKKLRHFKHPRLKSFPKLEECVCYEIHN